MIQKFSELIECLKYEKRLYPNTIIDIITKDQRVYNCFYGNVNIFIIIEKDLYLIK